MAADHEPTPWVPVEEGWVPAEEHVLDRLELLAEVVHPQRGRIIRELRQPRSVAELAEHLGVPITRLYHHVNRLEEAGLVRVDATRRVGAATERRYCVVARRFEVDHGLFERSTGVELGRALGTLFDVSKAALQRELELGAFGVADLERLALLSLVELRLTDERRVELLGRLRDVVDEFTNDEEPQGTRMRLFVAAFPETP